MGKNIDVTELIYYTKRGVFDDLDKLALNGIINTKSQAYHDLRTKHLAVKD